jgi:hypothetical protein
MRASGSLKRRVAARLAALVVAGTSGRAAADAPLLTIDVAPPGTPEARTLAAAVLDELTRYQTFAVAPARETAGAADDAPACASAATPRATYCALIRVDHASVVTRAHHVHRYREALLTATLAITDLRTGARVFQSRARAAIEERAHDETDAAALARLEAAVLAQWMTRFRADAVERVLSRRP